MNNKKLDLIKPGEILLEEFLIPLNISQNKLSRDIDVPVSRINDIIKGRKSITIDTAIRFARYFSTSTEFWLNLQNHFDIRSVEEKKKDYYTSRIVPFVKLNTFSY
jgi:addiction module HigA family antidote